MTPLLTDSRQIPHLAFNCRVNSALNPEKINASTCFQTTYDDKHYVAKNRIHDTKRHDTTVPSSSATILLIREIL